MEANLLASKQARLNFLDFYKGICILFVIVTHYDWTDQQRLQFLFPFWIEMAVPVFMVITGYVTAMSYQKYGHSLRDAYHPREILRKWVRFVAPFVPVFIIEICIAIILKQETISIFGIVKTFARGGYGPGSYYFPIILQTVVIIPLVRIVIKKYHTVGLIGCFGGNVLFEIGKTIINMSPAVYRLCMLRYLFILAYGVYLYYQKDAEWRSCYWIMGGMGVAYIIMFKYTAVEPIITNQWTTTSVFGVLFIIPIMNYLMKLNRLKNRILEELGKASYNILLVQMVWYWAAAKYVYGAVSIVALRLIINIAVCCFIGVAFHKVEEPITQRLVSKLRENTKY